MIECAQNKWIKISFHDVNNHHHRHWYFLIRFVNNKENVSISASVAVAVAAALSTTTSKWYAIAFSTRLNLFSFTAWSLLNLLRFFLCAIYWFMWNCLWRALCMRSMQTTFMGIGNKMRFYTPKIVHTLLFLYILYKWMRARCRFGHRDTQSDFSTINLGY